MSEEGISLFTTAREIFRKDGADILIRRGLDYLENRLFQYSTYYVYEHIMKVRDEKDF